MIGSDLLAFINESKLLIIAAIFVNSDTTSAKFLLLVILSADAFIATSIVLSFTTCCIASFNSWILESVPPAPEVTFPATLFKSLATVVNDVTIPANKPWIAFALIWLSSKSLFIAATNLFDSLKLFFIKLELVDALAILFTTSSLYPDVSLKLFLIISLDVLAAPKSLVIFDVSVALVVNSLFISFAFLAASLISFFVFAASAAMPLAALATPGIVVLRLLTALIRLLMLLFSCFTSIDWGGWFGAVEEVCWIVWLIVCVCFVDFEVTKILSWRCDSVVTTEDLPPAPSNLKAWTFVIKASCLVISFSNNLLDTFIWSTIYWLFLSFTALELVALDCSVNCLFVDTLISALKLVSASCMPFITASFTLFVTSSKPLPDW